MVLEVRKINLAFSLFGVTNETAGSKYMKSDTTGHTRMCET